MNDVKRHREMKKSTVYVCVHGPPQCGKKNLARFLTPLLQDLVVMERLEVTKVDFSSSKPVWGSPFISVQVFSSDIPVSDADVNIFVPSMYSETKLKTHLGIKVQRLKQASYDIPSAMCTNIYTGTDMSTKINTLFGKLYSKRCTSSMARVASDTDTICFMDIYSTYDGSSEIPLNMFLYTRPHVHSAMQALCGLKLGKKTLHDEEK